MFALDYPLLLDHVVHLRSVQSGHSQSGQCQIIFSPFDDLSMLYVKLTDLYTIGTQIHTVMGLLIESLVEEREEMEIAKS